MAGRDRQPLRGRTGGTRPNRPMPANVQELVEKYQELATRMDNVETLVKKIKKERGL